MTARPPLRVLGIDPGTASTGFGVVDSAAQALHTVTGGVISTASDLPLERRLAAIAGHLSELLDEHEPDALAIEQVYFGRNVRSAMAVGQARGAVLAAAGARAIPCFSYTPQAVKLAVCGSGAAPKDQVQRMVAALLGLEAPPASDHAADALALAICHAHSTATTQRRPGPGAEYEHMIASLSGKVTDRRADHVVIECGGVGFRVAVSSHTLSKVPAKGRDGTLRTHMILRDDGAHLYGFSTDEERELFLQLISVAGVGPKMALAVLSGSTVSDTRRAIAGGDVKRFQVVPGIGRKTAERVIVELRERIAGELAAAPAADSGDVGARALAREGLVGLGYDPAEAERMLEAAAPATADDAEPEDLIAAALRTAVKAA